MTFKINNSSSFYLKREAGYSVLGTLGVRTEVPGLEIDTGLEFGIADENVFDEEAPVVTLPDVAAILDSLKFSPQMAVGMLRLMDAVSLLCPCTLHLCAAFDTWCKIY